LLLALLDSHLVGFCRCILLWRLSEKLPALDALIQNFHRPWLAITIWKFHHIWTMKSSASVSNSHSNTSTVSIWLNVCAKNIIASCRVV
jgi:hypothetical protein